MESENTSTEANLWNHHQQVSASDDHNKQFYQSHFQPMHSFDLQEIKQQSSHLLPGEGIHNQQQQQLPSTPDNVHFLRDNNGPFIKIYYDQRENPVFLSNTDVYNSYLPPDTRTTQTSPSAMPFQQPTQQQMMMGHHSTLPPQQPHLQQQQQKTTLSNSVIHHLVTSNLGPGKFGTFGGNNNSYYDVNSCSSTNTSPLNISIPSLLDHVKCTSSFTGDENRHSSKNMSSPIYLSPTQSNDIINGNNENITPNLIQGMQGNSKKQRIVAEVKPMRMSYSDVVSKNAIDGVNNSSGNQASTPMHSTNSSSSSPNTTMPISNNSKSVKSEKSSKYNGSFEKKHESDKNRKSPTTVGNLNLSSESVLKRTPPTSLKQEKPSTPPSIQKQGISAVNISAVKKKKVLNAKEVNAVKSPSVRQESVNQLRDNQRNHKYITDSERSSTIGSDDDDEDDDGDGEKIGDDYYNVRKNVYQGEHHKIERIRTAGAHKKIKQSSTSTSAAQSQKKLEKTQQKRVKVPSRKQKHEFAQKIIASCLEYVYIFAKWLWMLIYDVSYLSFGIIWDRLDWYYQCFLQGVAYLRRELEGNPGKVFILWLQNVWKRFDARFDKKSKWAVWRWMFKKQTNNENSKDNFKDGRLPKTAEEAMKSLLNCKEKDAYSILGVSPDCPQEQIKKHYKKIAVLVHPDKNKQPGAEEAFKILQRSFELIGETESRKQYDENLCKAMHTEKAFNELNDLLIQLQTKISEAANTIRCSACCFRHPRNPTGRKAFAARECKTCKIRHAGREGDIWAETTLFGLRWKYLALMEGNVYDITEWALCQRGALSHLQPNSCVVQYKIVLGGNQQPQNQNTGDRFIKKDPQVKEDDFFLNNIYAGQGPQQQHQNSQRRRYKKN